MKWIVPRRQSVRARRRAMPPIATRPTRHVGRWSPAVARCSEKSRFQTQSCHPPLATRRKASTSKLLAGSHKT